MFRQFQGAIAQREKANIVLKLRGARQRMRTRTGRCEGRKSYGTNEGEQAIIARMKESPGRWHGLWSHCGHVLKHRRRSDTNSWQAVARVCGQSNFEAEQEVRSPSGNDGNSFASTLEVLAGLHL